MKHPRARSIGEAVRVTADRHRVSATLAAASCPVDPQGPDGEAKGALWMLQRALDSQPLNPKSLHHRPPAVHASHLT